MYFAWENICEPMIEFCRDPVSNALKTGKTNAYSNRHEDVSDKKTGKRLIRRFFYHLRYSGVRNTIKYLSNYMSQK